jgi:dimeric dUTPase (all-alpha-NTP-PPase superfamily)
MWQEMSDIQNKLNVRIGRDTKKDPNKTKWLFDLLIALEDEVIELRNCINWKWWSKEGKENQYKKIIDYENAKIEAIDCLHFLLTIDHLFDTNIIEIRNKYNNKEVEINYFIENKSEILFKASRFILYDIHNLINYFTDYTTSKNLSNIKYQNIKIKSLDYQIYYHMFYHLFEIFKALNLSDDDIYKIYKMKSEKNFKRQDNNYSVLEKTEDDNNEIKEKIK